MAYASCPDAILLSKYAAAEICIDEIRPNGVIAKSSTSQKDLTFDELHSIERDRRKLLLRVSSSSCNLRIMFFIDVSISPTLVLYGTTCALYLCRHLNFHSGGLCLLSMGRV